VPKPYSIIITASLDNFAVASSIMLNSSRATTC